jgi:hypothetical protein
VSDERINEIGSVAQTTPGSGASAPAEKLEAAPAAPPADVENIDFLFGGRQLLVAASPEDLGRSRLLLRGHAGGGDAS